MGLDPVEGESRLIHLMQYSILVAPLRIRLVRMVTGAGANGLKLGRTALT